MIKWSIRNSRDEHRGSPDVQWATNFCELYVMDAWLGRRCRLPPGMELLGILEHCLRACRQENRAVRGTAELAHGHALTSVGARAKAIEALLRAVRLLADCNTYNRSSFALMVLGDALSEYKPQARGAPDAQPVIEQDAAKRPELERAIDTYLQAERKLKLGNPFDWTQLEQLYERLLITNQRLGDAPDQVDACLRQLEDLNRRKRDMNDHLRQLGLEGFDQLDLLQAAEVIQMTNAHIRTLRAQGV